MLVAASCPVLRPCKRCPRLHYIWSTRTSIGVGDVGRVSIAGQRYKVRAKPRIRRVHCLHTNGSISIPANKPDKKQRPKLLLHLGQKLV